MVIDAAKEEATKLLKHDLADFLKEPLTSLGYIADPDDLSGRWTVEVVVKDRHRGVETPLRTSFQVLDP